MKMKKKILIISSLILVIELSFLGLKKQNVLGADGRTSLIKPNFNVVNTSTIQSILVPDTDLGADIGSSNLRFNNIYGNNLNVPSCTGCGGGGVTTTLASGQIAYGSTTSSIIGTENLKWNNSTQSLDLKGAIFSTGTVGTASFNGPGTGFAWIPSKGAVRWGTREGNEWNDSNIGNNSFCYGLNCKATGEDSSGLGYYSEAGGARAIAAGSGSIANGPDQVIVGQNNYGDSTALRCTVVGTANICYGGSATLVGWQNITEAEGATVIGSGGYNNGYFSALIALNSDYNKPYKKVALDNTLSILGGNTVFGSNTEAPSVVNIFPTSTTGNVLMLKGTASSTGDYLNVFTNTNLNLFKIDKDGGVTVSGTLKIGRGNSTGQCTLDGAVTPTCTHTVPASCIPICTYNSSALSHTISCAVSGTTLTAISATTLDTGVVNYHCF